MCTSVYKLVHIPLERRCFTSRTHTVNLTQLVVMSVHLVRFGKATTGYSCTTGRFRLMLTLNPSLTYSCCKSCSACLEAAADFLCPKILGRAPGSSFLSPTELITQPYNLDSPRPHLRLGHGGAGLGCSVWSADRVVHLA